MSVGFSIFRQDRQAGFTLIELMVSITISLLLLAGILQLYLNVSRTNAEMSRTNVQIENGRFAVQLLSQELEHAGFWDGYIPQFDDRTYAGIPGDVPGAIPDPCLIYNAANWTTAYKQQVLGVAVNAYEVNAAGVSNAPVSCSPVPLPTVGLQPNTDILVIRYAENCLPGTANCSPDTAGWLYFQPSNCDTDPAPFYVFATANFTMKTRSCGVAVSNKRKYISSMYYVRNYANTVGDGIPTLMRSQYDLVAGVLKHQAAVPLIEGVQGFRVEFGIDNIGPTGIAANYGAAITWDKTNPNKPKASNRGDGVPDIQGTAPAPYNTQAFRRCTIANPCTAGQMINVVAVKLFLLVRNPEASPGYVDTKSYQLGTLAADASIIVPAANDNFQRHLYSSLVRLNNISGRREVPP